MVKFEFSVFSFKKELFRYENKKRMFKPDDLEPKYKPRPAQQQRHIQEPIHRSKPRVYQGNGVTFEVSFNPEVAIAGSSHTVKFGCSLEFIKHLD